MIQLFIYEHNLSPFLIQIGSFGIRWYSIMYILGFSFCYWFYHYVLSKRNEMPISAKDLSDMILYAFVGMLLGARTVYMLFYNFPVLLSDPLSYFQVWNGGLSFHGGLIGVIIALYIFLRKKNIPVLYAADRLILPVPLTLFFGRIGNFINGELYGKVVSAEEVPFCVIFPNGGPFCRVPSQLIEGLAEGVILFALLLFLFFKTPLRNKPGSIFSIFILGYGVARYAVEFVREPDSQLGSLWGVLSMGQLLSLPMIFIGTILLLRSLKRS